MPVVTLTDLTLRTLRPVAGRQVIYVDKALKGFGVRVSEKGAMSYVLTYGVNRQRVKIGDVGIIKLAEARSEAKRILAELTLGTRTEPNSTFSAALTIFLENSEKRNKPRTAKDYKRLLNRHFLPLLGRKQLADITTHDIAKIIDQLLKTPSECSHAFVAIKIFFRWVLRRRLIKSSPCEALQGPTKPVARDRVLTSDELKQVFSQARIHGFPFGTVLQFLILTGQRRTEIGSLKWAWIDSEKRTITLPASVTKNKREHRFPYSDMLARVLDGIPRTSEYLFAGSRNAGLPISGWSNFKAAFDKRCEIAPWSLHDLRRTFATNLAAIGVRLEVTEKLLNHVSGSFGGIVGIYQRHGFQAEMRDAVERYEKHLATLVAEKDDVPLPRAAMRSDVHVE
jgi:integrase